MKLFIAGICGTFMAGIAQLARASGHSVCGCDENVYPPMSTVLEKCGIRIEQGYLASHLDLPYDQIIIGNALSRGNAIVESTLDKKHPFQSGPEWLRQNILQNRKVIAISGTHGKTTTSSIATWLLQDNALEPGYLIGGKPGNFESTAATGEGEWFVIEADEYDTAFFDKRSKFVHYCPSIAVINNLEFDHADIFDSLDQIKRQFHHLIRIVPSNGDIIYNADDQNVLAVLDMGNWSNTIGYSITDINSNWFARPLTDDCSEFEIYHNGTVVGTVSWGCIGQHNMTNALAAVISASIAGVSVEDACDSLQRFVATARRLQLLFNHDSVYLYDDFAHHPTAIESTLNALSNKHADCKIIAVVEPRSNTMRGGHHIETLGQSFNEATETLIYQPENLEWQPGELESHSEISCYTNTNKLLSALKSRVSGNTVVVCMSNGGFDGVPAKIAEHFRETMV